MRKLWTMILALTLIPTVTASAATFYTEQTTPEGHPPVTYFEMETIDPVIGGTYVRLRFGFEEKDPFKDGMYSIDYIVLNNEKILITDNIEYTPYVEGHPMSWLNLSYPSEVKVGYSLKFYQMEKLPPSINGKWYLQEVKFTNLDYDIVQNNGYPGAYYELEHADLKRLPLIKLSFGDTWEYEVGDSFVEPGFTAESTWNDEEVEELTSDVVVDYGVITPGEPIEKAGTYIITYTVEDSQGNLGSTQRLLIVGDAVPPTISNDDTEEDGDAWEEENTSGEGSTSTFDLNEFVNKYWLMIVLVIFLVSVIFTKSPVQALAVTGIVLIIAAALGFNVLELAQQSILENLWEGFELPGWLKS